MCWNNYNFDVEHIRNRKQNVSKIITKPGSLLITKRGEILLQNAAAFLLQNASILLQNAAGNID